MSNINALSTIPVNLKLKDDTIARVHFEHLPRVNETITLENTRTRYTIASVDYKLQKDSAGDVTCESIDIQLVN